MPRILDHVDHSLVIELQKQVPLDHRPFQILGRQLGLTEQECVERVARLKADGVIRQVSALLDLQAMGYQRTLAAMKVPSANVEAAARTLARHPGLSHLDQRHDPFNLWFTIAVPPGDPIDQVLRLLHEQTGAEETLMLPTIRIYKSPANAEAGVFESSLESPGDVYERQRRVAQQPVLTPQDLRAFAVVQEELPLIEMPYAVWAEQAEMTEEDLFAWIRNAQRLRQIQRIAAFLEPHPARTKISALIIWQVSTEQVDAVGEAMALFREVAHCHRRPVYPNWPYPLFTVIHAASSAACMEVVRRMEERVGAFPHKHLFSTMEYKRARVKYFSPELDRWRSSVEGHN